MAVRFLDEQPPEVAKRKSRVRFIDEEPVKNATPEVREDGGLFKSAELSGETTLRQPTPMEKAAPDVGQFIGGVGGAVAGGLLGRPRTGSAVAGTIGRGLGNIAAASERAGQLEEDRSLLSKALPSASAFIPGIAPIKVASEFADMPPEKKESFLKSLGVTAAVEAGAALIGLGAEKLAKNFARTILGRDIADLGTEKGYKTFADVNKVEEKFAKETVPKAGKLFQRLKTKTGKVVGDTIKKKHAKTSIDMTAIKNNIKKTLPKSGDPTDLLEQFAPKAQQEKIKILTDKVMKARGYKAEYVWQLRQEIDDALYNFRWTEGGKRYLKNMRNQINEPLRNLEGVAKAFDDYSAVAQANQRYGKIFTSSKGLDANEYSEPLEGFASNLLSGNKTQAIKRLSDIEKLANADDRVLDELLAFSAGRKITAKGATGRIPFTAAQAVADFLNLKSATAKTGAFLQNPLMRGTRRLGGRGITTGVTEALDRFNTSE